MRQRVQIACYLAAMTALVLGLALGGCGEEQPRPKKVSTSTSEQGAAIKPSIGSGTAASSGAAATAQTATGGSANSSSDAISAKLDTREGLQANLRKMLDQANGKKNEFAALKLINQRLCERLQRLRNDCAPAVRVIPESSEKVLACIANVEDNARFAITFSVVLGGTGGEYKIIGDNTYETQPFRDGETKVQWTTSYNTDVLAPRLYDFSNLRLRPTSGAPAPLANITFQLKVNGKVVLTQADLTRPASGDLSFYQISPANFLSLRRSAICRIPSSEIDGIRETARNDAAAQQASGQQSTQLNLAAGVSNRKVEFIAKRIFKAIVGRYPLLSGRETFLVSPLKNIAQKVSENKFEAAAKELIDYPDFRALRPDETLGSMDLELATDIVRRMHLGLLEISPDSSLLPSLAERVRKGERAKLMAELLQSPRFQQIILDLGE